MFKLNLCKPWNKTVFGILNFWIQFLKSPSVVVHINKSQNAVNKVMGSIPLRPILTLKIQISYFGTPKADKHAYVFGICALFVAYDFAVCNRVVQYLCRS